MFRRVRGSAAGRPAGWLAGEHAAMRLHVEETIEQEVKAGGGGDAKDKAGGGR